MAALGVNLDLVARLREWRKTSYPNLVEAVRIVEEAGAGSIVAHLRQDRRHIQEKDLFDIRDNAKTGLNAELAAVDEMMDIALKVKPRIVTLVPEEAAEVTTQGGLNLRANERSIRRAVNRLAAARISVSLFVEPTEEDVMRAHGLGARTIELYTGSYAHARSDAERKRLLRQVEVAASRAREAKMLVRAGHGLDIWNIGPLHSLGLIDEYSIGHSIILRSIFVGLKEAVREMLEKIK